MLYTGYALDKSLANGASDASQNVSPYNSDDETELTQEMRSIWGDVPAQIAAEYEHNFHHRPVKVARHHCPFSSDAELEAFKLALAQIQAEEIVPKGYNLFPEELKQEFGLDAYPTSHFLRAGKKGKELRISLPEEVWKPRAIHWCQALDLFNHMLVVDSA